MQKNVLLGVTASIAAYKACELISILTKKGIGVRCAMTPDSEHFITPLTLETLSNKKVVTDMFKLPEERDPVHIQVADEADLIVVAPATADIIGKVAHGICDDVLSCTICAASSPVLFAPAMNDRMYKNPIVQDNIKYLTDKGYHFISPIEGNLACGRTGMGHLAQVEDIVKRVEELLS